MDEANSIKKNYKKILQINCCYKLVLCVKSQYLVLNICKQL